MEFAFLKQRPQTPAGEPKPKPLSGSETDLPKNPALFSSMLEIFRIPHLTRRKDSDVAYPLRVFSAHPLPTTTPQAAWIPTNKERYSTHSTAVAQKEPRVAQTQAAGNRKDTQNLSPEEQHLSTGNPSCCTAPPQDFHRSTFSFSESRTAFSFAQQKKKWFWPPPGRQKPTKQRRLPFPPREKADL